MQTVTHSSIVQQMVPPRGNFYSSVSQRSDGSWDRGTGLVRRLGFLRRRYALLFIHGEKQIVGKSVPSPYTPSTQIKVDIGAGRQPHVFLLAVESDRAEFDIHVFREKLDLWHRRLQVGLHAHHLMRILLDPRPSFERNGGQRTIDRGPITSKAAWHFGLLTKGHCPGPAVLPLSQSFATHVIVVAVVGM